MEYRKFEKYLTTVLEDFKEKKKAMEIILVSVRSEVIQLITSTVEKNQIFIGNRYFQSDMDEVKDIIVSKKDLRKVEEFD